MVATKFVSALGCTPRRVLVICGGPSAEKDLPQIPLDWPELVISANEHGFKQNRFKVNYVVSCDYTYSSSTIRMDDFLRQFGAVNINRWSWADYRLPEWNFNGDSGLTAIRVGALLGGHPVCVVGLDRFVGDRRYFWTGPEFPGWQRNKIPNVDVIRETTKETVEACHRTQVRVMNSPMRAYWRQWREDEVLPRWVQPDDPAAWYEGKLYTVFQRIFLHHSDPVDTGPIRLTDNEARPHLNFKKIAPIIPAV